MYYIGAHATENLNDDYMGSGKYIKRAIKKHGVDNFTKVILETFDNKDDMFAREAELVTQKEVDDPMCYNICLGGLGGGNVTPEIRKKMSESHKGQIPWNKGLKGVQPSWNKGKTASPETRKKQSESHKGQIPWNKGIPQSPEAKKKSSQSQTGERNHFYGKHHTPESNKKRSESLKRYYQNKRQQQCRQGNSTHQSRYLSTR